MMSPSILYNSKISALKYIKSLCVIRMKTAMNIFSEMIIVTKTSLV